MANIATAYVNIVPSMKGTSNKISSLFNKEGKNAGEDFSKGLESAKGKTGVASAALGAIAGVAASVAGKAFDALAANVGAAVNRLDILNNYPKVMKNLGYSAEASAQSIQTIVDHLDGLPSTTDSIAQFVQGLASSTGNLDQATKAGLAFNDMMLAGGASSEAAANAMDMFSRMVATGKYNSHQFASIISAAPGQMNMLAESLLGAGKTGWDLQAALQAGTISTDELLDAMVALDEEGTGATKSFAEQAKAATAGVGTAFENFGNRIAKAMADVMDAIGQENISGPINALSKSFGLIGKYVSGIIKDVKASLSGTDFSPIVNAFKLMGESLSGLLEPLGSLVQTVIAIAVPCFGELARAIADIVTVISDLLTPVIRVLMPVVNGLLSAAIKPLTTAFSVLSGALEFIIGILRNAFVPVMAKLEPVFNALGAAISPMGDMLGMIFEKLQPLKPVLDAISNVLSGVLYIALNNVASLISGVVTVAVESLTLIFNTLGEVVNLVAAIFTGDWDAAATAVTNIFNNFGAFISNIFGAIWQTITSMASGAAEGMRMIFGNGVNSVIDFFRNLPANIMGALGNLGNLLVNAGKSIIDGFFRGIKDAAKGVFDFVGGIADKIASLKGPLPYDKKVLIPNGLALMQSLNTGIQRGLTPVLDTVTGIAGSIEDTLANSMQAKVVHKVGASIAADTDKFNRQSEVGVKQVFNIYANDPQLVAAQVAYKQRQALSLVNL